MAKTEIQILNELTDDVLEQFRRIIADFALERVAGIPEERQPMYINMTYGLYLSLQGVVASRFKFERTIEFHWSGVAHEIRIVGLPEEFQFRVHHGSRYEIRRIQVGPWLPDHPGDRGGGLFTKHLRTALIYLFEKLHDYAVSVTSGACNLRTQGIEHENSREIQVCTEPA